LFFFTVSSVEHEITVLFAKTFYIQGMSKSKIHEYLLATMQDGERLSQRKMRFCIEARITLPTLHKVLNQQPVSRLVALRVSNATHGAIHPGDLVFPSIKMETLNDQRETNATQLL
tara:strand:+ start:171 stop:518 length:348 start_codon:yes stop_codon:yes gene_type:complete